MRSLYWKIFVSFWLASIFIIVTIAWITSALAEKSALSARERVIMDGYANAAVATYESGGKEALQKWFAKTELSSTLKLYLLTSKGAIYGHKTHTDAIQRLANEMQRNTLNEGIIKKGNLIISNEILSPTGVAYRLVALTPLELIEVAQIPWADLLLRLIIAVIISGIVCYLLSRYLTYPLRLLQVAARSLATGNLQTRVGPVGHIGDEISELSQEFDNMAAQIETLLHAKERLLQDISHELRTPLARLQIALEIARKKTGKNVLNEFDRMELECVRLNSLIGEILEYARLEKSTNTITKEPIDLTELIQQIEKDANFEHLTTPPRVLTSTVPGVVFLGDKRLIHRAIENILRNALKYSPPGEQVLVALIAIKKEGRIVIEITDHGPGVPEEELDKIFSPFYRVDTAREKKTGGFGLGLAIAQQAICLHHGQISASNVPSGGLCVRICLPI